MDFSDTIILSESYRVAMDSLCNWLHGMDECTFNQTVDSLPSELLVLLYHWVFTDMKRYEKHRSMKSLHEVYCWLESRIT